MSREEAERLQRRFAELNRERAVEDCQHLIPCRTHDDHERLVRYEQRHARGGAPLSKGGSRPVSD
jgi:hypothetical protein